jgi:hypothetical protein
MAVAPLSGMPTQSNIFDESPALDGPDYVALVIEWDELADDLERQLSGEESQQLLPELNASPRRWRRRLGVVAGILGVAAVSWGVIHKLRS